MKIGQCYQCGKKIGRRLPSGQFRYYGKAMEQVEVIYEVKPNTYTHVVVPVCTTCADSPDINKLELGVAKDKNFKMFKKASPNAVLHKIEKQAKPEVVGD